MKFSKILTYEVKHKIIRTVVMLAIFFIGMELGRLEGESTYLKRLVKCVRATDGNMIDFYGHGFKEENLTHTMWNHAEAYNANIYIKCMFKDNR